MWLADARTVQSATSLTYSLALEHQLCSGTGDGGVQSGELLDSLKPGTACSTGLQLLVVGPLQDHTALACGRQSQEILPSHTLGGCRFLLHEFAWAPLPSVSLCPASLVLHLSTALVSARGAREAHWGDPPYLRPPLLRPQPATMASTAPIVVAEKLLVSSTLIPLLFTGRSLDV